MGGTGVHRRIVAAFGVAVLVMTAAFGMGFRAAAKQPDALAPHPGTFTIIAFGSSSTEGAGASSPAKTYPALLQHELRAALPQLTVTVLNRGIGGQDVDDMMPRLPGIIGERPDLIVWQTGSNDSLRDVPLVRFIAKTREGIAAIRKAGIALMLMEPQDCAAIRAIPGSIRYRDAVRAIATELNIPLIRRYDLMHEWIAAGKATEAAMMSGDDLHMNDVGYALLAHAVAREVLAVGGFDAPKHGTPTVTATAATAKGS
jgi:acyl-CoA thioesterase I